MNWQGNLLFWGGVQVAEIVSQSDGFQLTVYGPRNQGCSATVSSISIAKQRVLREVGRYFRFAKMKVRNFNYVG